MKKVLASMLSILLLLLPTVTQMRPAVAQELPSPMYGDPNGDGKVSADDALLILRSVVGKTQLTALQAELAQVIVAAEAPSADDALHILQYVVGKRIAFLRVKEDVTIATPTYAWEYTKKVTNKYEQVQVIDTYEQYLALQELEVWNETAQFDKYTQDYFENKSLFVLAANRYRLNSPVEVEFVWVADRVLQVQMVDVTSCLAGDVIPNLFFITEINKLQSEYDTIRLNVFHLGLGSRRENPECWKIYCYEQ